MTEQGNVAPKKEEPKGVGGWLLLFCLGQTLLGPARTLQEIWKMWERLNPGAVYPVVRQYEIVATAVTVLVMIYGIVVGIFIWRGSARGRSLARQYLVVRIAVAFLFCALSLAWAYYCFSALTAKRMAVTMAPLTLVEIAVALIWLGYFTYSKRVRNTYPTAYAVGMTNDQ